MDWDLWIHWQLLVSVVIMHTICIKKHLQVP